MVRWNRWSVALLACALLSPQAARAWKPYTHNYTGDRILADVDLDAGKVLLNGTWYDVDPRVSAAIRRCPACYMAGTVGPDGFPDLAYGQGVIHPVKTGEWLQRLVEKAWEVQDDPRYGELERAQALAWTYGFLTHAAGDVWGHTLVNEFAGGVFPEVSKILTNTHEAAKAIRHIIIEGVVGDATPGYDANPDRTVAPGGYGRADGDVSEDSTPGVLYDVPVRFVYEALVDPRFPTPQKLLDDPPRPPGPGEFKEARGQLVGFFLELSDDLSGFVESDAPDPLQAALDQYDETLVALRRVQSDCNFGSGWDFLHDLFWCPRRIAELGYHFVVDSIWAFAAASAAIALDLAHLVLDAYLAAWVQDIDRGLRHWAELGLASTQALFDAQTRRGWQNEECWSQGPEDWEHRAKCEEDVGLAKVLREQAEPFVFSYGLSMMGAPDVAGDVARVLDRIADTVDDILGVIGLPFQPLHEAKERIEELIKDQIEDAISAAIGIDVEQLKDFLKKPHNYVCLETLPISLPRLGPVDVPLFDRDEHARLDAYLGLAGTDHHVQVQGLPEGCGFLRDDVVLDPNGVAAIRDTVVMGKLALMTGPQLDALLGGILGREIRTYAGEHDNVLVKALGGGAPWLLLIDGDHSWRVDGEPVFPVPGDPGELEGYIRAGRGTMPLWHSCVLRPAFRALFQDWENPYAGRGPGPGVPLQNFPQLNDWPGADDLNDPAPPASRLEASGAVLVDADTTYVGGAHGLTLRAEELEPARGFPPERLQVEYTTYTDPLLKPPPTLAANGVSFSVDGPDGTYYVDYHAGDPCHPLTTGDENAVGSGPERLHTVAVVLDRTPPAVTCATPPFGGRLETDDTSAVDFAVADAASGLEAATATLDGVLWLGAPVPIANGDPIDAYLLAPGTRTVAVAATDRLGNAGTAACTFEVIVTSESLRANLARAHAEGGIQGGKYVALRSLLDLAVKAHRSGRHLHERKLVHAFADVLRPGTSCREVDVATARHLVLYADWFVRHATCGPEELPRHARRSP